jgi:tetratricopeptide (TPR) repeat protein
MESREGVCLGVSILYLCLAQRIGLPLEIITPPGHIYVRYRNGLKIINIETTARGVNLPSDTYLGLDTRRLQERNLKEVIGLAYINQASVAWGLKDYTKTLELYEKARPFIGDDHLLNLFMGLNSLFVGKTKEAKALLETLRGYTFDWAVSSETMADDYLTGHVDAEGMKTVFMHVDETRESIKAKQKALKKTVKKHPRFRAGLLQLAVTWLQLGRSAEAEIILEKYHHIDPTNSVVEYYLAAIATQRFDYNKAWRHLQNTESILKARDHKSPALRNLRNHLRHYIVTQDS